MLISSVVTIPNRTNDFLVVLDELLNSTILPDFLYVSISEFYPRLNLKFTELDINQIKKKLENYPIPNKIVNYKNDIGPLAKLLTPLINHDLNQEDIILIFDDDNGLFPIAIESIMNCINSYGKEAVYGIMGVKSNQFIHGESISSGDYFVVDFLGGYRGVCYPINLIDKSKMIQWCNSIIHEYQKINTIPLHDDHIFNYYLKLNKIESRVVRINNGQFNYNPKPNDNGIFNDSQCNKNLEFLESIINKIIFN